LGKLLLCGAVSARPEVTGFRSSDISHPLEQVWDARRTESNPVRECASSIRQAAVVPHRPKPKASGWSLCGAAWPHLFHNRARL